MTVITTLVGMMIFSLLGCALFSTVRDLRRIRKEDDVDISERKRLEAIRTFAAVSIAERKRLDREADNGAIEYWYVIKEAAEQLDADR